MFDDKRVVLIFSMLILLMMIMFSRGCAIPVENNHSENQKSFLSSYDGGIDGGAKDGCFYSNWDYLEDNVFIDSSNEYTAFVRVPDASNFDVTKNIRAVDVAELLYIETAIHEPIEYKNLNSVYFVVVDKEKTYDEIFMNSLDVMAFNDHDHIAFIVQNCDVTNDTTELAIVIRDQYFISDDVSSIAHMLTHVVHYYSTDNNDFDSYHENVNLWSRWQGKSLMSRTIQTYEGKYRPRTCDSTR